MKLPGTDPGPAPPPAEDWQILKSAIKRFESAWRDAPRPGIDDYLPAGSPIRSQVLLELVHIDLELRLKSGESARIEEYMTRYPELNGDRPAALGLIAAEHSLRLRREPTLSFHEYVERFPHLQIQSSDQITRLLDDDSGSAPAFVREREEKPPEVPGYEIVGLLGRGGMGAVYKARQERLDRHVAIKFLPEECVRDPAWLARFRREARTASALNHPYICTIFDTGEAGGRPFLSMELVEGRTLEELIRQRPPVRDIARLIGQAAQALAAAHAAAIVHRDIKPANLMVRDDGILKVLDFGLARHLSASSTARAVSLGRSTSPGARVGTLRYMSPEQARGEPVDAATDIFSLGLVMYELTTGQHPFTADAEVSFAHAIIAQTPIAPSRLNPEIPAAMEALIQHMLAKDARLRPTAVEVEASLAEIRAGVTIVSGTHAVAARKRPLVGRQQEWAALRATFEQAVAGHGSLVCVTGEPGLGKTTLVESFLDELAAGRRVWRLARGRCSERLAGAEAYLPFLEALDSLLHGPDGATVAQEMKVLAPTWYLQLVPLAAEDPTLAHVIEEARQGSQERRKRELAVFLREMSRWRPMVIFLDDVHWADPSSVDLLAYLGSRCAAWHLLFVLTYRPSDLLRSQHPFGQVKLELQGRGLCREIALPFLMCDELAHYLTLAFEGHRFPAEFASVIQMRTEGNPLFVVDLLHYLRDSGVIVHDQGHWSLAQPVANLQRQWPESVRGMIQRKIDQLAAADRQLLMAASVQGPEFDSAVIARLLDREAADVEDRLHVLEHVHYLVRKLREQTFPDGTLAVRYGFVHALYQDTLHAALQPTRKALWSAAAATALLEHHGEKSAGLAAEIALLFEAARDRDRAASHYLVAAENAARIYAHHEAVSLARRGVAQLQALPETPHRIKCEFPLQVILGMQLQIAHGFAAPEAERIYARARRLYEQLEEAPPQFQLLWGMWMFYEVRGEPRKSRQLAEQLLEMAQDPGQLLQARQALAITSFCQGDPTAARRHMEEGVPLYDPQKHSRHSYLYGQDPRVGCLAFGALALWVLGYPEQAVSRIRQAVLLAGELGQPGTLSLALHFTSVMGYFRRQVHESQRSAESAMAIATEYNLSFWHANARFIGGWLAGELGSPAEGVRQMRHGLTAWAATGGGTHRTFHLALIARILLKDGKVEEALDSIREAMGLMHDSGEYFHGAELHRLEGEILLLRGPDYLAEAEGCFHQALAVSRKQHARSFELRAATSLARLYLSQGRRAEARPILHAVYSWFTEGLDTPDLRDARELLSQLS